MIKTGNFQENIHDEEYEKNYIFPCIDSKDMIYDAYRETELLSGQWHFQVDQYDTCLRSKWYEEIYKDEDGRFLPVDFDFEHWDTIKVPATWNIEKERCYYYEGPAVYTRTFHYLKKGEERVFIKFGAVNYEAKVFLNKKYLGYHKGGSTPFYIEVTDELEEDNRILLVVDNTRKTTNVPCKNTDWFNYGGIYRDVELIRLPKTFIKDCFVRLVPDSGFGKIKVNLKIDGPETPGEALIEIPELGIKETISLSNQRGEIEFNAAPELWCPDNPKLYDILITCDEDVLHEKVGFREIKVDGQRVLLNGKEIFLKGICAHEESVLNGKAVTEEEVRENFRLAKEMNCNYMRLAHYPHTERAAQIADEMGIMLWEEIPVYWAIDFNNASTYQDAENQLAELIKRDRNRASVIIWSVGNENADTDERLKFMSSLVLKAKELDETRKISAACLIDKIELRIKDRLSDYLDIIGINEYYGWYEPDFNMLVRILDNSKPTKPVVITEFGADARQGARGTINDLGTEDCQLEVYKKQVACLDTIPYIKGTTPWILFDFRCPRRTNILQSEYNTKGLLSADKKYKKPAYFVMKKFYENK